MNLQTNINLMRLPKVAVMNVGGEACIVLPIKRNDLYVSMDDRGKVKAVYLDLVHFENREPSQYGDTHLVKQSHSKEYRQAQTDEQKKAEPILGKSKPMAGGAQIQTDTLPAPETDNQVNWEADDPFADSDPLQ